MVACLFAVALLAFVVHQAHGSPRCFLMVSSINVNKVFGPHNGGWKEVSNGYGPLEITIKSHGTEVDIVGGGTKVPTRAYYNETRGCIVGGYAGDGEQDNRLLGALTMKPNSDKVEWPKGYMIPLDAPMYAPFLGLLEGATSTTSKSSYTFADCVKFGLEKKAKGVQWHYKTDDCRAYFGPGVQMNHDSVSSSINPADDDAANHYRSMLLTPITFYSTPEERIPFGPELNSLHECLEQLRREKLEAIFISWNRYSKLCYRSTKGGLIPFDDINYTWENLRVSFAGPPKLDSGTFKCKPKA